MNSYRGYIKDGRLFTIEGKELPEGTNLIITVLEDEDTAKIKAQNQSPSSEAWLAFVEGIRNCDEVLPEEFDEIVNDGVNFTRELDL
jgi:hypothetical protein